MLLCLSCTENMFCFLLTDTYFVFPPAALSPGTGEFLHSLPVSPVRLLPLQVRAYALYVREASVSRLQFLLSAGAYLLCTTLPFLRTENRQLAWYDFLKSLKAIGSIMYTQMDVICCLMHQIALQLNLMMQCYLRYLCLFTTGSQYLICTSINLNPPQGFGSFRYKIIRALTSWLVHSPSVLQRCRNAQPFARVVFFFSDMKPAFQSTFAASLCPCRLWWRTPAAAASMAPSPLTMTSTPTPSSSSPASSATARGTSRGPARSSSGGIVFDTTIGVNGAIYYHSQVILNPK